MVRFDRIESRSATARGGVAGRANRREPVTEPRHKTASKGNSGRFLCWGGDVKF